jgi:hypothetical protein
LDIFKIRKKNFYCTLEIKGDGLPDLPPWFGNEADLFEELPVVDETPYQFQ